MPDYRTIPPTIEGVCRFSATGKCCVTEDGKPVCPPDRCDPDRMVSAARDWFTTPSRLRAGTILQQGTVRIHEDDFVKLMADLEIWLE